MEVFGSEQGLIEADSGVRFSKNQGCERFFRLLACVEVEGHPASGTYVRREGID